MIRIIEMNTAGAMQFVVDQDRQNIYPMQLLNLRSEIKEVAGVYLGINLLMDIKGEPVLLGTFDNVDEVMREINELYNTDHEIYCISGFKQELYTG